jgi:hypothetical protein
VALLRPGSRDVRTSPALPQPGTQAAAELHLKTLAQPDAPAPKIAHREHGVRVPSGGRPDKPGEWDVLVHWLPAGGGMPLGMSGHRVLAEVVHSRWLVRCPYCPSASRVSAADPRFFCTFCGNEGEGFHAVVFPDDREHVEALLSARPIRETRNWRPHETVADLQAENRQQGPVDASRPLLASLVHPPGHDPTPPVDPRTLR